MILDTDPPILGLAAIAGNLTSPNELDRNGEPANVVDGLFAIARALNGLADAVGKRDKEYGPRDARSQCPECKQSRTLSNDDEHGRIWLCLNPSCPIDGQG